MVSLVDLETAIGEDDPKFNEKLDQYLEEGGKLNEYGTNGLTLLTRLASHGKERLNQFNHLLSKMSQDDLFVCDKNRNNVLAIARQCNHRELVSAIQSMMSAGKKPYKLFPDLDFITDKKSSTLQYSKVYIESIEAAIDKENPEEFCRLLDKYIEQKQSLNAPGTDGFTLLTRLVNSKLDNIFSLNYLLSKMTYQDVAKSDGKGRRAIYLVGMLPFRIRDIRIELLSNFQPLQTVDIKPLQKPDIQRLQKSDIDIVKHAFDSGNLEDFCSALDDYMAQGGNLNAEVGHFTLLTYITSTLPKDLSSLKYLLSKMSPEEIWATGRYETPPFWNENLFESPISEMAKQEIMDVINEFSNRNSGRCKP